ncbi:MAG: hypothetical protein QOH41_3406 [Blastocatellia bacterium]|jgi:hypothetical protein|nr:hypothetical protein [Blastocatellia bacterium]
MLGRMKLKVKTIKAEGWGNYVYQSGRDAGH